MIKLKTINPGTKFRTTAVEDEDHNGQPCFFHFEASREHASIWGLKPKDIVDVECEIVDNDLSIESILKDKNYDNNCTDYFCCARVEKDSYDVSLIFANIKLFFMCFPYGCDIERYWHNDITDSHGGFKHKKGDRRTYMMRLKVKKAE